MAITCRIEFSENENGVYYAGETIHGTVILILDKPKNFEAITYEVIGQAKTLAFEEEFRKTKSYPGYGDYITKLKYLLRPEKAKICTLAPGTHKYNFDFQLPIDCAISLKTLNAQITYNLKVTLVRSWKPNKIFQREFKVLRKLDLNELDAELRKPISAEIEKTFNFNVAETLRLVVNLPKSGFVIGENIPLKLLVNNESRLTIESINIGLYMLLNGPIVLNKIEAMEVVLSHCNKIFNYDLTIPETAPPTCFQLCDIIKNLKYEIQIVVKLNGLETMPVLSVPIIIGSEAFKEQVEKSKSAKDSSRTLEHNAPLNVTVSKKVSLVNETYDDDDDDEIKPGRRYPVILNFDLKSFFGRIMKR